jgi:hypothetical protein
MRDRRSVSDRASRLGMPHDLAYVDADERRGSVWHLAEAVEGRLGVPSILLGIEEPERVLDEFAPKAEAAQALGKSIDWLEDHVMGDVRTLRRGASVLIPVRELEAWVEKSAGRALG